MACDQLASSSADAAHQQKLGRADDARGERGPEGETRGPHADPHPERVARPPVEDVDAEGRDHERDREMHHHHVERMPDQRDLGADIEPQHLQHDGTGGLRVGIVSSLAIVVLLRAGCASCAAIIASCARRSASARSWSWPAAAGRFDARSLRAGGGVDRDAVVGDARRRARAVRAGHGPVRAAFLRPGWGASVPPHRWIVLGGLALPAVVLVPLVAYGLVAGERLLPLPGVTPPRIEVRAERWGWTFRYPDHGGKTTAGVLHLPAGTPVDIVVTSRDVIHSFWIPRLAGKIDAIPGRVNVLRIQADAPGRYEGLCAEFCGTGHAGMRFEVVAHPAADFAAALARPARPRRRKSERAGRTSRRRRPGAAAAPRARRDLGHRAGPAAPRLGQPLRHRPAHHGHGVRVLRDRRPARHADARPARDARRRPSWTRRPTTRSSPCTAR